MTGDRKAGILVVIIVIAEVIILGGLWYLAVERTAITDAIDPQPNLSEEATP